MIRYDIIVKTSTPRLFAVGWSCSLIEKVASKYFGGKTVKGDPRYSPPSGVGRGSLSYADYASAPPQHLAERALCSGVVVQIDTVLGG